MKKYDSYKDSGVEWIGEIPSHWEVTRIKYKFQIGRGRVISNEDLVENGIYPVYSSQTLNNGCLGFIDTYDFDDKLITWTTDGANAGTVFLREGKFNCTNVCGTLKAKSDEIIPEYDYYFLQYATQFYKRPDTNGAKIMNNEMAVILSLKLSNEEQTAIANYLDQKTTQLDDLIAKKERLIQLLEEKRTAIINQAVTKGLDPSVPMKDSGIEWLGEIPEHWEVKKLKYEFHTLNTKRIPLSAEERGRMEVREYDYYGASGVIDKVENYLFDEDLILIGEDGANLLTRSKRLVFIASGKYWVNNHAHIIKPISGNINYFCELLELIDYTIYISGSAQPKLTQEALMSIKIPVPPVTEQNLIFKFLEHELDTIDKIVVKTQQEIDLLKEYKTALISEVVTGKVDVRNEVIPEN